VPAKLELGTTAGEAAAASWASCRATMRVRLNTAPMSTACAMQ
jgi:hypothetical protein